MLPPCLPAGAVVGFAATGVEAAAGSGPWVGSGSRVGAWPVAAWLVGAACPPVGVPGEADGWPGGGGGGAQAAASGTTSRQISRRVVVADRLLVTGLLRMASPVYRGGSTQRTAHREASQRAGPDRHASCSPGTR